MRIHWRLAAVWACFLARLCFYAAMLPMWEGYDEWAHFSVIRAMAVEHRALVPRDSPVPDDIAASLQLAPVPWEMRSFPQPSLTHDDFWRLPPAERARRESAPLVPIAPHSFTAYEALQPPLYYWLMTPLLWLLRGASLATQVLTLRWAAALIASLLIPLLYFTAREVFSERTALGCAAVVALMPGLALDVARVGNDCLAVVLFSLLTLFALKGRTVAAAITLGFGLLTKVYFLAAVPALALIWFLRRDRRALWAAPAAFLIAAWWYLYNLRATGTLTGLSEAVLLTHARPLALLRQSASINWLKAVDSILLSHLYFGGWSSLTVRSWMYHLFYAFILLAAAGLLRVLRSRTVLPLAILYAAFWAGQLYNVLLLYASKGLAGSMGWYMYAVVAAQAILTVAGLRAILPGRASHAPVAIGALLFGLLDLYTVHAVAIPYYTGLIRHRSGGALEAFHLDQWRAIGASEILHRLAAFKGSIEPALLVLWIAYLISTAVLGGMAFFYRSTSRK